MDNPMRQVSGRRRSRGRLRLMSIYDDETSYSSYKPRETHVNGNTIKEQPSVKKRTNATKEKANTDKDQLSGSDITDLTLSDLPWGSRWLEFVDSVSVVGLRYAVDPKAARTRRYIWTWFILVGVGFMTYQIYER